MDQGGTDWWWHWWDQLTKGQEKGSMEEGQEAGDPQKDMPNGR